MDDQFKSDVKSSRMHIFTPRKITKLTSQTHFKLKETKLRQILHSGSGQVECLARGNTSARAIRQRSLELGRARQPRSKDVQRSTHLARHRTI